MQNDQQVPTRIAEVGRPSCRRRWGIVVVPGELGIGEAVARVRGRLCRVGNQRSSVSVLAVAVSGSVLAVAVSSSVLAVTCSSRFKFGTCSNRFSFAGDSLTDLSIEEWGNSLR
jgi:hypothetical protein